jgi:hypothetical protein
MFRKIKGRIELPKVQVSDKAETLPSLAILSNETFV